MSDFLEVMAEASRQRAREAQAAVPLAEIQARASVTPPAPRLDLAEFGVIAEVKLVAPSAGELEVTSSVAPRVRAYVEGGASAISVLTEPTRFGGDLEHLREAAAFAGSVPVMRKDFLVDPYQVFEGRAAGAGGVLVITELFDTDAGLSAMLAAAEACGMFVLLESFSEEAFERAVGFASENVILGINCRDLRSLKVDADRFARLGPKLKGQKVIAESGLVEAEDVARVASLGYAGALIGTALMRAGEPTATLQAMIESGRRARCMSA